MDVPINRRSTPIPPPSRGPNSDRAELTHDCLINVLSRLTSEQLWTGPMLVCRLWLRACTDPSLHCAFDLEARFDTFHELLHWWLLAFERRADSMLRSVVGWSNGGLTVIRARHCSDHALDLVAERRGHLSLNGARVSGFFRSRASCWNVTDAMMARIASRCANLRELDISYCDKLSHESLELIGRNRPNLKVLKRNLMDWLDPFQDGARPQDGHSEAAAIGKFMPRLEHLEIRFSKLTANGLMSICDGCLDLVHLDLLGCANLTSCDIANATSNLKNLKEIIEPNYFPGMVLRIERYGSWRLYDEWNRMFSESDQASQEQFSS